MFITLLPKERKRGCLDGRGQEVRSGFETHCGSKLSRNSTGFTSPLLSSSSKWTAATSKPKACRASAAQLAIERLLCLPLWQKMPATPWNMMSIHRSSSNAGADCCAMTYSMHSISLPVVRDGKANSGLRRHTRALRAYRTEEARSCSSACTVPHENMIDMTCKLKHLAERMFLDMSQKQFNSAGKPQQS